MSDSSLFVNVKDRNGRNFLALLFCAAFLTLTVSAFADRVVVGKPESEQNVQSATVAKNTLEWQGTYDTQRNDFVLNGAYLHGSGNVFQSLEYLTGYFGYASKADDPTFSSNQIGNFIVTLGKEDAYDKFLKRVTGQSGAYDEIAVPGGKNTVDTFNVKVDGAYDEVSNTVKGISVSNTSVLDLTAESVVNDTFNRDTSVGFFSEVKNTALTIGENGKVGSLVVNGDGSGKGQSVRAVNNGTVNNLSLAGSDYGGPTAVVTNEVTGRIDAGKITGGTLENYGTANVSISGYDAKVNNYGTADVSVSDGATFNNTAKESNVVTKVSGGAVNNSGTLTSATVSGGNLQNYANATVKSATVSGGSIDNNGTIDSVLVSGGAVYNTVYGTINDFALSGGAVNNSGTISNLTYTGGTYSNGFYGGSVENLVLGTEVTSATAAKFGTVDSLSFTSNGVLHSAASLDGDVFSFAGAKANSVDLSNGSLWLDFSEVSDVFAALTEPQSLFALADVFGAERISGALSALYLTGIDGEEPQNILAADYAGRFALTADKVVTLSASEDTNSSAATPEPATMLLFGLGLAGLAVARRRKK
jgi:hypothetical protein